MEMEQEPAMGVKPAEGCGKREKEQQDILARLSNAVLLRVPFSLALQGQVTLELEAWLSLQRWQGATAEVPEEPVEEARQVPQSAEQSCRVRGQSRLRSWRWMVWQLRKQISEVEAQGSEGAASSASPAQLGGVCLTFPGTHLCPGARQAEISRAARIASQK